MKQLYGDFQEKSYAKLEMAADSARQAKYGPQKQLFKTNSTDVFGMKFLVQESVVSGQALDRVELTSLLSVLAGGLSC